MTKKIFKLIVLLSSIIFLFNFSAWAVPALINYQGMVTDEMGNPLTGSYNMAFYIFTAESGGTDIWNEQQTTTITNGLYSVQLGAVSPFPAGMFDNDLLYLEVRIDNEILAPRQRITSTAFSIKAGDADTVDGYHASDFVGADQTNSITGSMIEDNSVSSSDLADNSVTSEKIVDGTIQQTDLSFSLPDGYSLDAHDGDPKDVVYVDNAGNVGIGTAGPTQKLDVIGNIRSSGEIITTLPNSLRSLWGNYGAFLRNDGSYYYLLFTDSGDQYGSWNTLRPFYANLVSGNVGIGGNALYVQHNGNVGIGTREPAEGLELYNKDLSFVYLSRPENYRRLYLCRAGIGSSFGYKFSWRNDDGSFRVDAIQLDETGNVYFNGGNVGIGTTEPLGNLHVAETDSYLYTKSFSAPKEILFFTPGDSGIGFVSSHTGSFGGAGTAGFVIKGGDGNAEKAYLGVSMDGDYKLYIKGNGNVGIGTTSPDTKLEIYGNGSSWDQGFVSIKNVNNDAGIRLYDSDTDVKFHIFNSNSQSDILRIAPNGSYGSGGITITQDGKVGIGTTTPEEKLHVVGSIKLTGGSDLAEPFEFNAPDLIKPGMIVSIDPERAGKLKPADSPYDHCVAGIISGAGGIKPGLLMMQEDALEGEHQVALVGRVYGLCDASYGSIKPGDLLTTSPTLGYAMKVTDYQQAQGAILGKAMTKLEKGKDLVLILVSLQ